MFYDRFFYRSHQDLPNQQKTTRLVKNAILLIAFFMAVLITSSASAASVTLAWDPNEPGPEGYMLFIRLAGNNYNYSAPALIAATTSCRVEGLVPGTTYYMVVRAYEGAFESGDSNEIEYTPSISTGLMSSAAMVVSQDTQNTKKSKPVVKLVGRRSTGDIPGVSNLKLTPANE